MPPVVVLKNLAAWSQQQIKLNRLIKDLNHSESSNFASRATLRCFIIRDISADAVVDQIGTRTFMARSGISGFAQLVASAFFKPQFAENESVK